MKYIIRTVDNKPVFLNGGKILDFNFNIDTQETELIYEKFL